MKLKETHLFLLAVSEKNPFIVPFYCKRGIGIISFRADNYAVATEILVNKYFTKVKLRASIGETQSRNCRHRITAIPRRMTQNVSDAM